MANSRGPNRAKYQKSYNAREDEKARRRDLGRARYAYEKDNGPIPEGMDMHHKKPKRAGGGEAAGNLKPTPASAHRGWNRGMKKPK